MKCICNDTKPCAKHAFRAAELMNLPFHPTSIRKVQDEWPAARDQLGDSLYDGA